MQQRVTTSGNPALATAADVVERIGVALGRILRESRPDVFDVPDEMQVQGLQPAGHDRYAAEHDAARVTLGRLTLPDEDGNYEYVADSDDEVLYALRQAVPELHSFENVEASRRVARRGPGGRGCALHARRLWYRSQSERRIAAALEAANVLFVPNASARLGITADHRHTMEPDFPRVAGPQARRA